MTALDDDCVRKANLKLIERLTAAERENTKLRAELALTKAELETVKLHLQSRVRARYQTKGEAT